MITVIETNRGYNIAVDGQVLSTVNEHGHHVPAYLTAKQADEARAALGATVTPVGTRAVTPAKARFRPDIQRYAVKAAA